MPRKFLNTTAALITMILLIVSMAGFASAQLSHVGNTPPTTEGYPDLGPLPAGVTPDYTF